MRLMTLIRLDIMRVPIYADEQTSRQPRKLIDQARFMAAASIKALLVVVLVL